MPKSSCKCALKCFQIGSRRVKLLEISAPFFTSFSDDFTRLGSEKHAEWIYIDAQGCCDATANRVLCGCPAAGKPSRCSARPPMGLFCSVLEKWVLKQRGQKLWPEGSSTSWEWPLALSEQSIFLSKTFYRRSGSGQTLCKGNSLLQPQPPFKFRISILIPNQKYLHAWS